ncbi:MAG: transcription termination/antitermination NusG family protein [Dehalococcoidia bacterium]|nr:transcription termination/antitermination NusG family protein [Dehalococcoidia bacterium]
MALKWYVARTRPLAEYAARDHLETAGLEVFMPCARTCTPRLGHEDMPLFPGYLFLRYDRRNEATAPCIKSLNP